MAEEVPLQQDRPPPVGYRFHPTDEELVDHYLRHKLLADDPSIHNTISEIDICNFEPWDLPPFSQIESDDPEWYFFSPIKYKYSNSTKAHRATSGGYWKATGRDRKIRDPVTDNVIGTKKTLVFYQGKNVPGIRNNWVIHEYHDARFPQHERTHVLCKLLKKPEKKTKEKTDELVRDECEPNDSIPSEYENQANPEDVDSLLIQTHGESNGSSRIQTSSEVDSTVETPQGDSEEFDVNSFLLFPDDDRYLPPSMDGWKW
ncbi:hypothetical protein QN277_022188 [Acacia crassicarpa]|uniref:NAC domain-containing protein n=1 Tax=Acacia crassicarpa TaxID=499986 RepID=A0AAE1JEJ5_9FABA|nr:hypothetical protein QN277_022188 [Acacia crassicarpa]